jgi:hypothetical protein
MKGLKFDVGDQVLFADKKATITTVATTTLSKYEGSYKTTSVEIMTNGKRQTVHIEDLRNAATLDHLYE